MGEGTKKRIWLHIGATKTGTTAFQSFCAMHAHALEREGILYPETGRAGVAHHRLAWAVNPQGPTEAAEKLYGDLFREIGRSDATDIVISSEVFFIRTAVDRLAGFLTGHDVRILVFLRRQDEWSELMYAQYVKQPEFRATASIADAPEMRIIEPVLDYEQWMNVWAGHFGDAGMICCPYFGSGPEKTDTIRAIFSLLGHESIGSWKSSRDAGAVNRSISAPELEIVRLSNDLGLINRDRARLLYHFQRSGTRGRTVPRQRIAAYSPGERAAFAGRYRESNERVFAKWSPFGVTDLFSEGTAGETTANAGNRDSMRDLLAALWLESLYDANTATGLDLDTAGRLVAESRSCQRPDGHLGILVVGLDETAPIEAIAAYRDLAILFSGHTDIHVGFAVTSSSQAEHLQRAGIDAFGVATAGERASVIDAMSRRDGSCMVLPYGILPGMPWSDLAMNAAETGKAVAIDTGPSGQAAFFASHALAGRLMTESGFLGSVPGASIQALTKHIRTVFGPESAITMDGVLISLFADTHGNHSAAFRSDLAGFLDASEHI